MIDEDMIFSYGGQDAIERFIFRREDHVHLALGVLAVQQRIKERIIKDFLRELEEELRKGIMKDEKDGDSWKVVNELHASPFERYAYIYLMKENWHGLDSVALGREYRQARGFLFGVWNNFKELKRRLDDGKIKAALDGRIQSGNTSDWWPFWRWADPYRDWDDPRTLACLYGERKGEAISFLSEAMLTIAENVESVIDNIVEDYEKKQHAAPSSQGKRSCAFGIATM
ncbi:MAG: hypothetical protein D6690_03995 [Nitrospirae bacterium]|nr:MAG: hypothetical protein D6690_03995 [Nitrospirota bacterium]